MLHQLRRALDRDLRQALDESLWGAQLLGGTGQDPDRLCATAHPSRMGRTDDGVAGLHGREHLVDDGGGRIGDRDQGRDQAHGFADGSDLGDVVLPEQPQRLHVAQIVRDREGVEQVLQALVARVAVARLLGGKLAEAGRFRHDGPRHGLHDLIDAFGRGAEEFAIGLEGGIGRFASLSDRLQVGVHVSGPRWLWRR